jgi:hypothetical protein
MVGQRIPNDWSKAERAPDTRYVTVLSGRIEGRRQKNEEEKKRREPFASGNLFRQSRAAAAAPVYEIPP